MEAAIDAIVQSQVLAHGVSGVTLAITRGDKTPLELEPRIAHRQGRLSGIVHDGSTLGYNAENVWYPVEQVSLTMLYNRPPSLGPNLNLTEAMGRIILGKPTPTPASK
jgi:hypothetical protein